MRNESEEVMGLWPIQGDEKRLGPATIVYGTVPLSFVIPSVPGFPTSPLSPATTYVVLLKENHMQLTEAATLDRKSGGAERSAVLQTFRGNADSYAQTELSSRPERSAVESLPRRAVGPERTRISYRTALETTASIQVRRYSRTRSESLSLTTSFEAKSS